MKEYKEFDPLWVYHLEISEDDINKFGLQILYGKEGMEPINALLEELDFYPNGSCWEGIVEYLIATECPEMAGAYEIDSESDCCLVDAENEADILHLATLIKGYFDDLKKLADLLRGMPEAYHYP